MKTLISEQTANDLTRIGIYLPAAPFHHDADCLIEPPGSLGPGCNEPTLRSFGAFSYSWSGLQGVASVGRYCSIASGVSFGSVEHEPSWLSTSSFTYDPGFIFGQFAEIVGKPHNPKESASRSDRGSITIGNDVWIGAGVYVRSGVNVGDGAILGRNAVITRDVPPYAIVVGNPGRVVKYRFPEETIAELLALRWWRYSFLDLEADVANVVDCIASIRERAARGTLKDYTPQPIRASTLSDETEARREIGRIPPGFDSAFYLSLHPDLVAADADPVVHFTKYGLFEGRRWR